MKSIFMLGKGEANVDANPVKQSLLVLDFLNFQTWKIYISKKLSL